MTKETLDDQITNSRADPLSAINVGIINDQGLVEAVITLEELVRTGDSQEIYMRNFAPFGEVEYELTVSNAHNLLTKVTHWRNSRHIKNQKENK